MSLEAIGYFLLTLFIETNDFSFHHRDTSHIKQSIDNHDAINEANRVEFILQNDNEANNYNVITHQLTKMYNYNFVAVKKLSLAIKKGEIFGLLGKNGSGKSTLCGTLTCEKKATSGMISICSSFIDVVAKYKRNICEYDCTGGTSVITEVTIDREWRCYNQSFICFT